MFANLKNKLIEEVKASPSKFQQLANAAQAAVSSASSTPIGSESTTTTTNENFFSITEEDTPQNSPYKPLKLPPGTVRGRSTTPQALINNGTGAVPRARKLSNSSVASDVSFRLPSYDAPAVYHLQSDLDETASEIDDSTSTAKLDVITKEQLYDAYKKSLDRYHKYRCRYTDLAKKYKDLERDSTKARSVLVETQEKAIRRINELREQCALEQQAKAHLEEALRMEMDDMQCKMQAYQTKLHLVDENPEHIAAAFDGKFPATASTNESLIDLGSGEQERESTDSKLNNLINLDGETEQHDAATMKIVQLEQELRDREEQLNALTTKMEKSSATIDQLRKQEEENALLLAQTKQAIHSELENKEGEVKKLKENLKKVQSELQALTNKEQQLGGKVGELEGLKDKLKQIQTAKQEAEAKLIATEHMLNELREVSVARENAFVNVEEKFTALTKESEHKLQDLRQQNSQLSEMVQRYQQNEISLAEIDNELNRTKNENDDLNAALAENERKVQVLLELNEQKEHNRQERMIAEQAKMDELLKQIEDERSLREMQELRVKQLEVEVRILGDQHASDESETIRALKSEMHKTHAELRTQLNAAKDQLVGKEKELKAVGNKLTKQKKQHDTQQHKINEQNEELEKLRKELNRHEQHLLVLQKEARVREEQTECEKSALKTQVANILHEIADMEEQMRGVQQSHAELKAEKRNLEVKMGSMQQQAQQTDDGTEQQLRALETKLLNVEGENVQMAEKNCLLEENSARLEKLLADRERLEEVATARVSDMRLQLDTAQDAIQKINEKMSQVLDENSRMQNAQELMDHDYRTLQDKYDAVEKEKLLAQDAEKCLVVELVQLKEHRTIQDAKLRELVNEQLKTEEQLAEEQKTREHVIKSNRVELETQLNALEIQLSELRATQCDDDNLKGLLQQQQKRVEYLQKELEEKARIAKEAEAEREREVTTLRVQINKLEKVAEQLERAREELELLGTQRQILNGELASVNEQLSVQTQRYLELETQMKDVHSLNEAYQVNKEELAIVKREEASMSAELEKLGNFLTVQQQENSKMRNQLKSCDTIGEELKSAQADLSALKEIEQRLKAELLAIKENSMLQIQEMETKLKIANGDVEKLHESNDAFQVQIEQLQGKYVLQMQAQEETVKQLHDQQDKVNAQLQTAAHNEDKLRSFEQIQLENEYLSKQTQQLESELVAYKLDVRTKQQECAEMREKLKSLQCELYVLKEGAEKHNGQLETKQQELSAALVDLDKVKTNLDNERVELVRQTEHAKFVTEQNDGIQQDLLHTHQQLAELKQQLLSSNTELQQQKESSAHEITMHEKREESLRIEIERNRLTIETLSKDVSEITTELEVKQLLEQQLNALRVEVEERNNPHQDSTLETAIKPTGSASEAKNLRHINDTLQHELEELKRKSGLEIDSLQQDIEDLQNNNKHMMERMMELESIRAGMQAQRLLLPVSLTQGRAAELVSPGVEVHNEKEELEIKLKAIMAEVQDVSNRNIFLEQKCENYLILEQSNERLKLQNAKLSRQLDETLVSMQHNDNITANTEFEYLKNIMFQVFGNLNLIQDVWFYMVTVGGDDSAISRRSNENRVQLGPCKALSAHIVYLLQYLTGSANGNNETLVKVISAVLKFSPQQTQVALEKEHQRRSLINKII